MTIIWYMVPEISTATDRFFLSSWGIFCPFTPLTAQKKKILKKWKSCLEISFYTSEPKIMNDHRLYCSWDKVCDRCNYFSFWAIFCPFTPLTARKIKISKKWKKNAWRYHHFTHVYQKLWLYVQFLRYGARQTDEQMDGQTDGQEKWHTEVGAPPKK